MRTKTLSTFGYLLGVFPLAIAFCSVAATVIASQWIATRDAEEVRSDTAAEARHVAAQLSSGFAQAFDPLQKVATWWQSQGKPMAPEDWDSDAELFLTSRFGLDRLIWLDAQGRVGWTARPGEAPDTRAARRPEGALTAAFETAQQASATTISPIVESDGRFWVYACSPVYRGGRLSGFIAARYEASQLVRSLLEGQMPDEYAVSVKANGREIVSPPDRGRIEFQSQAPARVSDGVSWAVLLAPSGASFSNRQRAVTIFGVVVSGLLYVTAVMARLAGRRAKEVAQLNRDLQRKLQEFQTLLEVLPVGIAVAEDRECRRIWTNRSLAAILKIPYGQNASHTPPEGESRPAYRMTRDGSDVPPEELPMQTAARTGKPVHDFYLEIVRADGAVLQTLSYAAPLFDEHGKVRGVIDACVDITARRQLETRLQQAEKYESLAVMAGGIAHDFNNLLTVIMGNASAAASHLAETHAARKSVREIEDAAARAAELVAKLLAYTGRFWRDTTPIDLSVEIALLLPTVRDTIPEKIRLETELATGLPRIEAGPAEVRQILIALVSNAVEALEDSESGEITLRTARRNLTTEDVAANYADQGLTPGAHVCLEVVDTGSGIADSILARVFDPFFTTKFVGRGLGLSAVHGIVRAHRGAIRLTSEARRGTRVEVIFPAMGA